MGLPTLTDVPWRHALGAGSVVLAATAGGLAVADGPGSLVAAALAGVLVTAARAARARADVEPHALEQARPEPPQERLDPADLHRSNELLLTLSRDLAQHIAAGQDAPLVHHPDYSRREIAFVAQQEKVLRLEDFLLRRSLLAMTGKVSAASLEEVAAVLADALGWTEDKTRAEVQRTVDLLHTHHGIALDLLTQAAASA